MNWPVNPAGAGPEMTEIRACSASTRMVAAKAPAPMSRSNPTDESSTVGEPGRAISFAFEAQ
jgi:hypothetical protein